MRQFKIVLGGLFILFVCLTTIHALQQTSGTATLFEGARLITGDGSAPIENSAFVVVNNRFTQVGKKGQIQAPPGVARVDLTGKTVIPGIIDAHSHLGHAVIKTGKIAKDTYSKENLVDHLRRLAYYGIAATQSMGIDRGEAAYELRANPVPGAALIRTAGRGIALPNQGPGAEYWKDASYGVTTEAEARKAVQELAAKKVDLVKIWVDDRNGTVMKLPPALYRPIIDEAHKQNLRVVAHIFNLADAKDLVRSGIDGFAHGVRDKDIDEEFLKLLKEHPNVFWTPNLPDRPTPSVEDAAWLAETVPAATIQQMRDTIAKRTPEATKTAQVFFDLQARNLKKLNMAGARIGFGTDSGTAVGWTAHTELADMVAAGMSPSQVLVAATKTSAAILKLDDLGMVAASKSADFVVLDANPLDDIKNTRRISKVYIRGKEVDRAAMRREWGSGS
jgi:imidazolonepropionase-like amidohydrolase